MQRLVHNSQLQAAAQQLLCVQRVQRHFYSSQQTAAFLTCSLLEVIAAISSFILSSMWSIYATGYNRGKKTQDWLCIWPTLKAQLLFKSLKQALIVYDSCRGYRGSWGTDPPQGIYWKRMTCIQNTKPSTEYALLNRTGSLFASFCCHSVAIIVLFN